MFLERFQEWFQLRGEERERRERVRAVAGGGEREGGKEGEGGGGRRGGGRERGRERK